MPTRTSEYWDHDLRAARAGEARLADALTRHPEVLRVEDETEATDAIDFLVETACGCFLVDLKEKRQPYGPAIRRMGTGWRPEDLFVVDETFVRRVVVAAAPVVLAVHDVPGRRWCYLTTWDLVLGPRRRYRRRIERHVAMTKGKLLYDLSRASASTAGLDVGVLLRLADAVRRQANQVDAVSSAPLPIV